MVEPATGPAPIYALLTVATHRIDLAVYELDDPVVVSDLDGAASRGLAVRVLLDSHLEHGANTAAATNLAAHHVEVAWADPAETLHEKVVCIDGVTCDVLTFNLTPRYYATSRDFAVVDTQPGDVAAIEQTFAGDLTGATPGPAPAGTDLLWSPGSGPALVALIGSARRTVRVENEEMGNPPIEKALTAAARRGVVVEVTMTADPEWNSALAALVAAGVQVHTYAPSAPLFIHAKAVVVDGGPAGGTAFVGSENFSLASLDHNRELGLVTSAPSVVVPLDGNLAADFAGGTPWS